jgi:CheY-like chemotaxis protein/anti-sigma regulatory factor (Ser/Thr protein kinase)/HPt (histidine-containing phosphotransfer) domain-containing protein
VVIDDILSYTRLESGNTRPENAAFDLHKCLENIISIYRASAFEKELELVLYIHTDVPTTINSDQNRINQILTNLLTNAIKFTASGQVVVEASLQATDSRQNTIHISVTDTGAGLGDNDKLQIFEPFTQADTSISRKYGGTGLGLSISKKLVELLGGEINVRDAPDGGTCFWFTLVSPITADTDTVVETPLTGTRILVYDQNSFIRRAIRNQFIRWGATVFIATDRERFLEMIESGNDAKAAYQLIVLGIPVEHCTNQVILEQLDAVRHVTDAPVLILAGSLMTRIDTVTTNENVYILSKPPRSERMLRAARQLLFGDAAPNRSVPDATQTVDTTAAEHPGGAKILVAEDNDFNQKLLTTLISDLGHRIVIANNGEEACRYANETVFDIILMDIHMPVMGGIEATRVIRKGINRATPIIALTADVFANKDEQLHASGIDDFLFKPAEKANLMALLNKWLTRKSSSEDTAQLSGNAGASETMPPELRGKLVEELTVQLHHLQQACLADDLVSLDRHLHQLRGIAEYFSLTEFQDGFQKLEHVLVSGCREETLQVINDLDRLLRESSH